MHRCAAREQLAAEFSPHRTAEAQLRQWHQPWRPPRSVSHPAQLSVSCGPRTRAISQKQRGPLDLAKAIPNTIEHYLILGRKYCTVNTWDNQVRTGVSCILNFMCMHDLPRCTHAPLTTCSRAKANIITHRGRPERATPQRIPRIQPCQCR